jgi:polysaccharide export outer membrane protein
MMAELKHRGLLQKPSVSVEISAYRPFFVLGEVTKPGPYPYQPDMSVVTAVAVAGGYTYRAVKSRASITRNVDGHTITGQATPETRVEPGDVINIFERSF